MERSHFGTQWAGFGGTCRSPKDVAWRLFGDDRPPSFSQELAVHHSLLFVQPGATKFLCFLEMSNSVSTRKKEAQQLPLKSEQRKNFQSKERTAVISLHALCTSCFARFSVSPTFLRAKFSWIAPIAMKILDKVKKREKKRNEIKNKVQFGKMTK